MVFGNGKGSDGATSSRSLPLRAYRFDLYPDFSDSFSRQAPVGLFTPVPVVRLLWKTILPVVPGKAASVDWVPTSARSPAARTVATITRMIRLSSYE